MQSPHFYTNVVYENEKVDDENWKNSCVGSGGNENVKVVSTSNDSNDIHTTKFF